MCGLYFLELGVKLARLPPLIGYAVELLPVAVKQLLVIR